LKFKPHQKPPLRKPSGGGGGGGRSRAPESTQQEVNYLKRLIEQKTPICVKLRNNEEVRGVVEYYDVAFIRLTRAKSPNLFIFKHEIKYLYEEGQKVRAAAPLAPAALLESDG
jgi:sRNA-binding regulator protein Hfq